VGSDPPPGANVTLGGRGVELSQPDSGVVLADTMSALAQVFGVRTETPVEKEGLNLWPGETLFEWDTSATTMVTRTPTGRELLPNSSFHVASNNDGNRLSVWGRIAYDRFEGLQAGDTGSSRYSGAVTTGVIGVDREWDRLLAGVAVSRSTDKGRFEITGPDQDGTGDVRSVVTMVSPYARYTLTDRLSVWGLVGRGTGNTTITFDDGSPAERSDLSMSLGALGVRGAVLDRDTTGGIDLALKGDVVFGRTQSDMVSTDTTRFRLLLEGSRTYGLENGTTLRPVLEIGLRYDGGDVARGTGVVIGGGLTWTNPTMRLSTDIRGRALFAHSIRGYREWGVSAAVRILPDHRKQGLSLSLEQTLGTEPGDANALVSTKSVAQLVPEDTSHLNPRLHGEVGYGFPVQSGRLTGTPFVGLSATEASYDVRVGWRLTPAEDGPFQLSVAMNRRENKSGDRPTHGIGFQIATRW